MTSIYCIHCLASGKKYVGQTRNTPEYRLKGHIRDAQRNTNAFAKAIQQYGASEFIVGLLEECSEVDANRREDYWINKLDTWKSGYNTMKKGISNRTGKKNSEESNRKRSETMRRRKALGLPIGRPPGLPNDPRTKYHSHEERLAAQRARQNPEGRKKKRNPKTGRYVTNK